MHHGILINEIYLGIILINNRHFWNWVLNTLGAVFSSPGKHLEFPDCEWSMVTGWLICGGFSENGPHQFTYLNARSEVGEIVCKELDIVAFLEEVCHWGHAQKIKTLLRNFQLALSASLFLSSLLCSHVHSQLLFQHKASRHAAMLIATTVVDSASETLSKSRVKCFLL